MRVFHRITVMCLVLGLCGSVAAQAAQTESLFTTKTKVRLAPGGIWVEAEISPRALLAALPQCDRNADGRLDEIELSQSRSEILAYFSSKVQLLAADKTLRADSTYFAFRSPATAAAVPDRFYIYHWYAVLRQPERLSLSNELFCELQNACNHHGVFVSGKQVLDFDFTPNSEAAGLSHQKTFFIASTGEAQMLPNEDSTLEAGYVWAGLGVFGFVFFRLASAARSRWGRPEEDEEEEELETRFPEPSPLMKKA